MFNRNFFIAVFAICGIFLFQNGCNENSTTPETEPSLSYFPLELGNAWVYTPEDTIFGLPFQWNVTYRNKDTVIVDRQFTFGSHGGILKLIDHRRAIDIVINNHQASSFYLFILDSVWNRRDLWECDDSSQWSFVKETNPIVTPAGTFSNCIRLERKSNLICADAGTMVEWWAPGVGLVRWDELNYYAGGPITIYLKRYKIY
jgi:hypothetical protein